MDLICLLLKKIDVVLGIDWLSTNYVYIVCKEKVIFIPAHGDTPNDVITTLLKGTVNIIDFLFEREKSTLDSH